jgi:acetylornithine deacetylase/succinyl-diaminopimelate desuccinylase
METATASLVSMLDRLLGEIKKVSPTGIAADLVRIASYADAPGSELAVCEYLKELFDDADIPSGIQEAAPGRYNFIATMAGDGVCKDGVREPKSSQPRSLAFCGHTDTVAAYDMADPLSGRVSDGILYGRGSVDMKGALAAMAVALLAMNAAGVQTAGDLVFAAVCDEEESGVGAADFIKCGPRTDGVIIGEPTSLIPCIGQKGLEWIRVRVIGKKTHGGNAAQGINAVTMAARFIARIETDYIPILNARAHQVLGAPTINIGRIEGGDQPSTVPGECEILLDRRCVPSETTEQIYDELHTLADKLKKEDPRFSAEIEPMFETPAGGLEHRPFSSDIHDPLITAAAEAIFELGIDPHHTAFPQKDGLSVFPAWADAGFIANYTNSSCIILGPGDLGLAHSPDECIDTAEIERAALMYALIAMKYSG